MDIYIYMYNEYTWTVANITQMLLFDTTLCRLVGLYTIKKNLSLTTTLIQGN